MHQETYNMFLQATETELETMKVVKKLRRAWPVVRLKDGGGGLCPSSMEATGSPSPHIWDTILCINTSQVTGQEYCAPPKIVSAPLELVVPSLTMLVPLLKLLVPLQLRSPGNWPRFASERQRRYMQFAGHQVFSVRFNGQLLACQEYRYEYRFVDLLVRNRITQIWIWI